ncbi:MULTISPECIES: 50S ribosomal protein L17 [Thermoactinomyces]|jgi:large subunit ribosomal protein L17|uniref:Large ribosomal subunit protein bL17 n=1 Tax=Thermoactinomyces vulgaris TaxID=2026 RepID=A0ABS0QKE2_THEVU|nr:MULTISPECIES: 50S ribosomal protein L17 [Thermoactinomyces]KFZ39351.1 50S ribosomal protein L17 [Thermoactinomyces sp. Gus2-1]KYQ85776.1 50S ribosomal protein L17 [Thermoactinomyces sp. AS95]MBA4552352.1 50S ribosomal protein L17 [Thermoactinomyces vulgaris]MBA4596693.1 50S ribosomal protein L17 [Thermoactinomyces vulgaris]MBH8584296.1 50S ribosomal protein L17 [Thermoactinomyces sp. CICC 10735]
MAYAKLGRNSSARKAMLRDLVTDLIIHERIETTEAKAKEVRSIVEKMITLGKRGDLHARRQAAAYVRTDRSYTVKEGEEVTHQKVNAVKKLFDEIAPRYEDRNGGYTRILKLGPRRGDGAPMVFLELVK